MKFLQNESNQNERAPPAVQRLSKQQQSDAADSTVPISTSSQIVSAAAASQAGKQHANDAGNYDYDPSCGLLFKALHLIETEIFYSEPVYRPLEHYGRVQSALAYLDYGPSAATLSLSSLEAAAVR